MGAKLDGGALLSYLASEDYRAGGRLRDVLSDFLRRFVGSKSIEIWSSLADLSPDSELLYTGVGHFADGKLLVPPFSRVMKEAELNTAWPDSYRIAIQLNIDDLNDFDRKPDMRLWFDSPLELSEDDIGVLKVTLEKIIKDHLLQSNSKIQDILVRVSTTSKDLTSFFHKCIQNILIPLFRFDAVSLFYYEEKTESIILGATTGILQQDEFNLKRSDIRYFIDGSSYTSRSFNENRALIENVYKVNPLRRNTYGEAVDTIYSRINIPLRTRRGHGTSPDTYDPVGILRAVNINNDNNYHPITAFQLSRLEYFCEAAGAFARRYLRVLSVLHDQERATHGYTTDLLTIKFAATTIQRCLLKITGGEPAVPATMSLANELHFRTADILAVQDNMAQQLLTVSRHVGNAKLLATVSEREMCTQPFTSIFMRLLAAKKGMSECYNRAELRVTSNGSSHLADELKDIPALGITTGALYLVIRNLAENAIKYTAKSETPRIDISWKPEPSAVRFIVRDFGIGIPARDRGFVFREGFRGREAQQLQLRGNGLGLAVSMTVLKEIGGDICYRPPPDSESGSVFDVLVPIR